MVLVVSDAESKVVRERWTFEVVLLEPEASEDGSMYVYPSPLPPLSKHPTNTLSFASFHSPAKAEKDIRAEIRAILRQVVGTNAYMPTLTASCTFTILAY